MTVSPLFGAHSGRNSEGDYRLFFELFFAVAFLLELLFLAELARLFEVALAIVWWRDEP